MNARSSDGSGEDRSQQAEDTPVIDLRGLSFRGGLFALSVAMLGGVWILLSWLVSPEVFPTPQMTWQALMSGIEEGYIFSDTWVTLRRSLIAFVFTMLAGTIWGTLLGLSKPFENMFALWLMLAASIPALLYVVVGYIMIGLNETATILGAVLVVTPTVTFNVWQGMKGLDEKLTDMARSFNLSGWEIFRYVFVPQSVPFLLSASRFGLAICWKIMVFVELLGASEGVGYRIYYWYQLFNMERVLASALPLIVIMILLERVVLQGLETYLLRWQQAG